MACWAWWWARCTPSRWREAAGLPGDAAGGPCARVRSEAPGEARSRESIIGCEGARGREANHACGEVGLMTDLGPLRSRANDAISRFSEISQPELRYRTTATSRDCQDIAPSRDIAPATAISRRYSCTIVAERAISRPAAICACACTSDHPCSDLRVYLCRTFRDLAAERGGR